MSSNASLPRRCSLSHDKTKRRTKLQIITKLLKDGYIDEFVWWNLTNSKFKKSEIEEIYDVFRKHIKKNPEKKLDS
jgi:hypothetical protein